MAEPLGTEPHAPLSLAALRARLAGLRRRSLIDILTTEFSIAEGALILMLAFLFSATLGMLRQILFNAQFGTGMAANAYYAAFRLPDVIAHLLAGGTLANAMIPVLLIVVRHEGEAAAQRLTSLIVTTLLAVIAPIVGLLLLFAPLFVRYVLAPGFDAATSELTVLLTRILLFELLIVVVTGAANAVLLSKNQFLLPALSLAVYNVSLISGIVAAMIFPRIGILGPTIGAVGDALLQLLVLVPGLRHAGFRYRPIWNPFDPQLRATIRLLIPNGLSGGINYAGGIVDTAFASLARTTAALPALANAWLLTGVPIRLLGLATSQAALPRLAAYTAAAEWSRLRRTAGQTLLVTAGLALLTAAGMILFARPAIALVLERGRFDAAAGDLTYTLLTVYMLGLPAYVATEVLTRALIALHDTRTPLVTNCLQLAGRIALIPLLLNEYGVLAIPLAFAVTSVAEALLLAGVFWIKLQRRIRLPHPAAGASGGMP